MANQEILNYLEQFSAGGKGFDEAKKVLLGVGWGEADIDEAIRQLSTGVAPKTSATPAPNASVTPTYQNIQSSTTSPANIQKTSAAALSPEPARGINKKVLFSIIVVVLCLLGGGAYAYFSLGIGVSEKPEVVLNEAITNLWNVKTLNSASRFELSYTGTQFGTVPIIGELEKGQSGKTVSVGVSLDAKGVADISDWGKQKVSGQFDLELNLPGMPKVLVKSDLVRADGITYLRLNNVNQWAALVAPFIGDVSSLEGKWIKINLAEFQNQMLYGMGLASSKSGFSFTSDPSLRLGLVGLAGRVFSHVEISKTQIQEIKKIFENNKVFVAEKELPKETVDGENSYHYRIAFDKAVVKNAAVDLVIIFQRAMMEGFGIKAAADELEKAKQDMSAGIGQMLDEAEKFVKEHVQVSSADVWIGKSSKQVKKVVLDFTVSHESLGGEIHFRSEAAYTKIGEPVAVEAPKDAILFESVVKELAQNNSGTIFSASQDNDRATDLAIIKSAISLYLADVSNPKLCQDKKTVYASASIKVPAGWKLGPNAGSRKVDGTGWIPVDLTKISSGAPIREWPIDPQNDPAKKLVYVYVCDSTSGEVEVDTLLVSDKYTSMNVSDGGDDPKVYEIGTAPGLKLIPKGFWDNNF